MQFREQVILVIGASSGMGRAVALRLADAGARVAVVARRTERLEALAAEIRTAGGECHPCPADVSDEDEAAAMVASVVADLGRIDAVLLNAGGAPDIDLRHSDAAEVKHYMRTNYDVVVNVLFPVLDQMRRQGHGLVAHTNSLAGFAGIPLQGPYSAAKGAARLLLDTCRLEFADEGIRFVTIYPGFVHTEATAADAMPAPMEISEGRAADNIVQALRREPWDTSFPWSLSTLVRALRVLPKQVTALYLRAELRKTRRNLTPPPTGRE